MYLIVGPRIIHAYPRAVLLKAAGFGEIVVPVEGNVSVRSISGLCEKFGGQWRGSLEG